MNYYIVGYHRETGKTVYRSALNEDYNELYITMEYLHKEFNMILFIGVF